MDTAPLLHRPPSGTIAMGDPPPGVTSTGSAFVQAGPGASGGAGRLLRQLSATLPQTQQEPTFYCNVCFEQQPLSAGVQLVRFLCAAKCSCGGVQMLGTMGCFPTGCCDSC
jgi:hypothetical protein